MRRVVDGPSSGIAIAGHEMRDEVDLRETRDWVEDLRGGREVVELRAATFPGIFATNNTKKTGG